MTQFEVRTERADPLAPIYSTHGEGPLRVGYVRVSTSKQADTGVSLEAQTYMLAQYALERGWQNFAVYLEVKSGETVRRRPVLSHLLELVRGKKIAAFLVYKGDRITRDADDASAIDKALRRGACEFHDWSRRGILDTRDHNEKFRFRIDAAVAERERGEISSKTRDLMRGARDLYGTRYGRAPYGWNRTEGDAVSKNGMSRGGMVEIPEEQAILRKMMELRAGGASVRAIALELNRARLLAPKARAWAPSTVHKILTSRVWAL